jgi:CO dehydrogenase/acetyl-CoA synthase beta subunit
MTTLDPMVVDALIGLGGAAAGYLTHWWQANRGKVVETLSEEIQDAIDQLEDATGLDVPDEWEDKVEDLVEDAVERLEDTAEEVAEAVEDGDLSGVTEVISEALEEAKADLDVAIEDLEDLTVAGLRERLKELGVDITGRPRKAELIQMIVNHVNGGEME